MTNITVEQIVLATAEHYKIPPEHLTDPRERAFAVTHPRHIAQYLSKVLAFKSVHRIALTFGVSGPAVWHNCKKISSEITTDKEPTTSDVRAIIDVLLSRQGQG